MPELKLGPTTAFSFCRSTPSVSSGDHLPPLELLEDDLAHGGDPTRPIVQPRHELKRLAAGGPELLDCDVPDFVDGLQAVGDEARTDHHHVARTTPRQFDEGLVGIRKQPGLAAGAGLVANLVGASRPSCTCRQRLRSRLAMRRVRVAAFYETLRDAVERDEDLLRRSGQDRRRLANR